MTKNSTTASSSLSSHSKDDTSSLLGAIELFGINTSDGALQHIPTGLANKTYKLHQADGRHYSIHVMEARLRGAVRNQKYLEDKLRATRLSMPHLLYSNTGMPYACYRDKIITVAPWIHGNHPTSLSDSTTLYTLGARLATFHTLRGGLPNKNTRQLVSGDPERTIQLNRACIPSADTTLSRALENRVLAYNVLPELLPTGTVHGDYHSNNILLDGTTTAVLDFERTGINVQLFDLARAIVDICADDVVISQLRHRAFLDGYISIRPLTSLERDQYSGAIAYAALSVAYWMYSHGYNAIGKHFLQRGLSSVSYHHVV